MKKTISLVLCVTMLMLSVASCLPAFAIQLDSVENSGNHTNTGETVSESETQLFADSVTITFVGDDLVSVPDPITRAPGFVDLTAYYNVTPKNSSLRFNGWSTTGKVEDIVSEIEVTESMNLYAIVNYDINLSIHKSGWTLTNANQVDLGNYGVMFAHKINGAAPKYVYTFAEGTGLNLSDYKQVVYYYVNEYNEYPDKRHKQPSSMLKFSDTSTAINFLFTSTEGNSSISVAKPPIVTGKNEVEYAEFVANVYNNNVWKKGGTLKNITVTPFSTGFYDSTLAYIRFVPYQRYEEDIEIAGVELPATGKFPTPETKISANICNIESYTWKTSLPEDGRFAGGVEYELEFVVSTKDRSYQFRPDVKAKLAGLYADSVVIDEETGKATITIKFPPTIAYKEFDFDLSTVTDVLITDAEPIQFEINVTEKEDDSVDTSVVWSITQGSDFAKITEDGLFTAEDEGTVTVQAASKYRHDRVETKTINVTFDDSLEMIDIHFDGDINETLPSIRRIKGSTINVANYYDCTSAIPGKRFNGWTATGDFKDAKDEIVVADDDGDGNMTLTAVVNYDFNFATTENQSVQSEQNTKGWAFSEGFISFENRHMVIKDKPGTHTDINLFSPKGLNLPAAKIAKIQFYIDPYVIKDGKELTLDLDFESEGLYFTNTGEFNAAQFIREKKAVGYAADGSIIFEYDVYANEFWADSIYQLRFDLGTGEYEYNVRYINVIEKEPFEQKELKIEGITVPKTGVDISTNVKETSGIGTIKEIKWIPDNLITEEYDGKIHTSYNENTEYTVQITVAPVPGSINQFAGDTTATINGVAVDDIVINDQGVAVITHTYPTTTAFERYEITINGPSEITKAARVAQYTATFSGDIPGNTSVIWSVNDTSKAEIDRATGKLVPLSDGTVTIKATSTYNPRNYAEFDVTISNQGNMVTITYMPGTSDTVTNMPSSDTGIGTIVLSTQVPQREGHQFLGWATDDETLDTVTMYAPGKDANVYAVWQKIGNRWDFDNGIEDFGALALSAENGYMYFTTTEQDWKIYKSNISINAAMEKKIQIKFSLDEGLEDEAQIFYEGPAAGALSADNSVFATVNGVRLYSGKGLDNWMIADFDMSSNSTWKGTIDSFRLDIVNKSPEGTNVRIDYIYTIIPERTITFEANGAGVTNMPTTANIDVGETLNITQIPERAGYQFLGWAKSSDPADGEKVKTSWKIIDDITLYAIWSPVVTPDENNPTEVYVGQVSDDAILVSTEKNAIVYLTYTDENGQPKTLTQVSNGAGYAVFDLTDAAGTITDAVVTTDEAAINSASVTSLTRANDIAEAVTGGESDVTTKDGYDTSKHEAPKYDMTVTDITSDGKIKPGEVNPAVGGEVSSDLSSAANKAETIDELMAMNDPIVVNFDKSYQNDFFHTIRRFIKDGRYDSMAMYINLGLSSSGRAPALYTEEFKMDTEGHSYVVMKVRNTGYSSNKVTMNFKTLGGSFDEANEITIENENNGEFSMFVWDMSQVKGWKGYIEGLYFAFGEEKDARTEVDWILFTDKVPENLDVIQGAYEYFPIVNRGELPFADVLSTDWFYPDVAQSYQLNFVNGTSETTYSPHGEVTIAETITLAVRLSSMYNGLPVPQPATEGEWYAPFVDAAVEAKLIRKDQFKDYNAPASRREVVQIIGNIFDEEYLPAINMFTEVPDLKTSESIYSTVLAFYNSGILVGDSAHNFNADTCINRSEIAAIINRFANVENRARVITQAEIESRRRWFYSESFVGEGTQFCTDALVLKDGYATAWSETDDPAVYFGDSIPAFIGKEVTRIVIGLKWDQSVLPSISKNDLYFTTASDASWSGDRRIDGHPGTADENGIVPFSFYTTGVKLFDDIITGLRFDPFSAPGVEFSIAYVMIE